MKTLKPNTKVNAVVFYKKNSQEIVMSSDMNMTFDEYNKKSLGKTQSMYNLDYRLDKTIQSNGYTFKWYVSENEDVLAQFVELS
jgi:hypothetical protein